MMITTRFVSFLVGTYLFHCIVTVTSFQPLTRFIARRSTSTTSSGSSSSNSGSIITKSITTTTTTTTTKTTTKLDVTTGSYLNSLGSSWKGRKSSSSPSSKPSSSTKVPASPVIETSASSSGTNDSGDDIDDGLIRFFHQPVTYFSIDKLASKGPRANADIGQPHDSTRKLASVGTKFRAGSWWCSAGGWPSPKLRTTTEIFHVLSGHGCLTDIDNVRHYFGPGDTVVLPKGWSGRWDVLQDIHKVWFVHDHPNIEHDMSSGPVIRAVITPYNAFTPEKLISQGIRADAIHGSPSTSYSMIYDVGPTEVGSWTCTGPGSFPVLNRDKTEGFHVLEGVFFLTNAVDGTAKRCIAGDTVILPKGWSGYWDVIEPVKKLWVVVD